MFCGSRVRKQILHHSLPMTFGVHLLVTCWTEEQTVAQCKSWQQIASSMTTARYDRRGEAALAIGSESTAYALRALVILIHNKGIRF